MSNPSEFSLRTHIEATELNIHSNESRINRFNNELASLSQDYSGNRPGEFLSAIEENICGEFIDLARERNIGGYTLKLETSTPPRVLTAHETAYGSTINFSEIDKLDIKEQPRKAAKIRKKLREDFVRDQYLMNWKTEWKGSGFYIGEVGPPRPNNFRPELDSTSLYLCTDGLLRCSRSILFSNNGSYASGAGRIPQDASIEFGQTYYDSSDQTINWRQKFLGDILTRILLRKPATSY